MDELLNDYYRKDKLLLISITYIKKCFTNQLVRYFVAAFLTSELCGCSSFYFHSDADQKQMEDVQKSFSEAKQEHLDSAGQSFDELFKAERNAVINNELTYRDHMVVALLQESSQKNQEVIDKRITELVGEKNVESAKKSDIKEVSDSLNNLNSDIVNATNKLKEAAEKLGIRIDKVENCKQEERNPKATNLFKGECGKLIVSTDGLNKQKEKYKYLDTINLNGGEIGFTNIEIQLISDQIKQQKKTYAAMASTLKNLEEKYQDEVKRGNEPGIDSCIRNVGNLLNEFLNPSNSSNSQSAATDSKASESDDKCKSSSFLAVFIQKMKDNEVTPENLNKLIAATKEFKPSLEASIRNAQADFAKTKFAIILNGISQADGEIASKSKDAVIASKIVNLLGYLEDYANAENGNLPPIPALQMGLTRARMAADLANAELAYFDRRQKLLTLRRDSQLIEANHLVEANKELAKGKRIPSIRRIGLSLSHGRMPAEVAKWEINNLLLNDWLNRYRVIAKANYEVLEPSLAQMSEYATGGITKSDIATVAHLLSLIAVAVGVN